jgi:AGCS family alanine or glycine:cation symporter
VEVQHFIERGLGVKWFGILFAVVSVISAGLPGVQANSVADGIQNAFQLDTWVSGLIVAVIFGAIVGGVKRIAKFTSLLSLLWPWIYFDSVSDCTMILINFLVL